MLQDIRKSSQGTVAKIIVGLIVVTFALFGVESIVGSIGGEPEVAEVNGEGIPESNYQRAFNIKKRQLVEQMGELADPDLIDDNLLRTSVLEGLIEQEVLLQDAESKDLYVSDMAIDRYISDIPQLKENGAFSNEKLQMLLRNAGLTLKSYRDSLRKEFLIAQPRAALIASSFLLDQEKAEVVALDRQRRTFGSLSVKAKDYLESVVVSDDEVRAYYDENKEEFTKPESVDVSYVRIDKQALKGAIEVSEEELLKLYESEKEAFQSEEQREASHILLKVDENRSSEEAMELMATLQGRISSGEDFAALASEVSEDEGSAKDGGSLGLAARGVYVSEFEEALYSLSEGEVSEPVKTEYGYHLIKLERVVSSGAPELDEVRDSLMQRIVDQKADEAYAELAEQLADISYAAPDLEEPAQELELEIKQLAGVSSETSDPLFSNLKIQRVLFAEELLNDGINSELIEPEEGVGIVFRVDSYHEAGTKSFAEVSEQVREQLVNEKASEFAKSVGQAFVVRVVSGEAPEIVAEDMGFDWVVSEKVERSDRTLAPELVSKVFGIRNSTDLKETVSGFVADNGDFSIVQLLEVDSGDASELTEEESSTISRVLAESAGGVDYQSYRSTVQRKAIVEKI